MYENLVAWLRDKDFEPICPCGDENICEEKDCAVLQAADAIEELQGRAKVLEKIADKWCDAVPKWIPVTERLPRKGVRVLCACRANIYSVMKWDGIDWYENPTHVYMAGFVTHWMPLPELPKEESE